MLCFTFNAFRVNRGLSLIEFALVPSVTLGIVGEYSFFFDSMTRTFILSVHIIKGSGNGKQNFNFKKFQILLQQINSLFFRELCQLKPTFDTALPTQFRNRQIQLTKLTLFERSLLKLTSVAVNLPETWATKQFSFIVLFEYSSFDIQLKQTMLKWHVYINLKADETHL